MRLWGGRFSEENDARVEASPARSRSTRELAADDLAGSIAHVRGLGRAGLLTDDEVDALVAGLTRARRGRRGRPVRLGPGARGRPPEPRGGAGRADRAGRRQAPHRPLAQRPGRDGPAALAAPGDRSPRRRRSSGSSARSSGSPSARARPSCRARPTSSRPSRCCSPITCWPTSRWPSATAAGSPTRGAGSTSQPARARARWPAPATRSTARRRRAELGFDGVTANSLDAVSDRDFVVEVLAAVALGMVHLSRLAEEITWWSNPRVRVRPRRPTRSRPAARSCRTRRTPIRPSSSAAARPASSGR